MNDDDFRPTNEWLDEKRERHRQLVEAILACRPIETPHRCGLCSGEFLELLVRQHQHVIDTLHHFERRLMTTTDDFNAKLDALGATASAANAKADTLIGLVDDLRAQIAAGTTSGGITVDDAVAMMAKIDGVTSAIAAESAKEDAAISGGGTASTGA